MNQSANYAVTIEGVAPILFCRYTGKKIDGKIPPEEYERLAPEFCYTNSDGLYCPAINIKKALCLASGVLGLKYGKRALGPILNAIVFIEPAEVLFRVQTPDFIHKAIGRIPPKTGPRVPIFRPALNPGWKLSFTVSVFDGNITENQIKAAIDGAGLYQGLCDWRPEYGRFIIKSFKKINGGK